VFAYALIGSEGFAGKGSDRFTVAIRAKASLAAPRPALACGREYVTFPNSAVAGAPGTTAGSLRQANIDGKQRAVSATSRPAAAPGNFLEPPMRLATIANV